MSLWRPCPAIYEIHTWPWLEGLSRRYGRPVDLGTVPEAVWDGLAGFGFDAVWLMGVWERSPAGRTEALRYPTLREAYLGALPDFREEDVVGSPYCVRRYVADARLGGAEGLAAARAALAARGVRLLLDFVPNHVARDHPWTEEHPEYLIPGDPNRLHLQPDHFFEAGGRIFAHGRDPYFPPWTDTAQVNAFHPGLRQAYGELLREIAAQCDGVRCDMAMLVMDHVFSQTWADWAEEAPPVEFWEELIGAVKADCPDFLFVAEAYWGTELELCQQGFDYCYDKGLYDRLRRGTAEEVRAHLRAQEGFRDRLVRFVENHDEERAAAVFGPEKSRAAALAASTLPGARLFHEGQFGGYRIRLPVQLGRRPDEPVDTELRRFYRVLLQELSAPVFHDGAWTLLEPQGWEDNRSARHVLAWAWRKEADRRLVVVNLSDAPAQGRVRLPWGDLAGRTWELVDRLSGKRYRREGQEMADPGLFVDLPAFGGHLFRWNGG